MRLSAALTSLGAALLHAAPSAAQTSTTTDVYDPPLLTAAGNVTGLPGGNEFCGAQRVRKPWGALSSDEQALYLEASRLAVANGAVAEFAAIAADSLGQAQGEYSCAFFSWHRRFLLAYESYLRELDDRFACLTVPYYDVHTAYIQSVNGDCSNMFDCSGIFQAIGGSPQNSTEETSLTFNGVNATGYATVGTPYGDVCTGNDNDEDNCGSYVVRDDVSSKTVPSAASFGSFQSVVATSGDYATFLQGIQYGVHHEVLDAIGGVFATAAAAHDVLYYSWHAALDMYLHVYHLCRIGVPLTYDQIIESLEVYANATQSCGGVDGVDAQSPLLMRITVDGQVVDASQHPTLGRYFGYVGSDSWNYADIQQLGDYSYTYQLPEMLRQQILSNNDMCTGFNRAFAATYTSLNATAVKSTMTSRTTTKTTTTKTTRIVNGKKVTTTKVTKTVTRANSTMTSRAARSTVTTGQLVSQFGYAYLGNFSTDDEAFGEGTFVTNGYTGYTAYYGAGAITTKHNGILSANFSSFSSLPSTSAPMSSSTSARVDATYSNTSNVVMNVTVGKSLVARNITASVATSGSYWAWLQTAYDGLYSRFDGNVDLVATHMKLLECYTFNSVYGLSNFTSTFVTNKNLVTNRVQCGQRLDLVRSGLLQLAVRSSAYTAESLRFASSTVISTIRSSYRRVTSRQVTYIRRSYTQRVQASLDSAQESLNNITIITNGGFGENETSTIAVDTGYVISNSSSTEAKSSGDTIAITTTTTTTTAADASDKLSELPSELTESDVAESTFAPKDLDATTRTDSWTSGEGTDVKNGMTTTTTGANGEFTNTVAPVPENPGVTAQTDSWTSGEGTDVKNGMTTTTTGANGEFTNTVAPVPGNPGVTAQTDSWTSGEGTDVKNGMTTTTTGANGELTTTTNPVSSGSVSSNTPAVPEGSYQMTTTTPGTSVTIVATGSEETDTNTYQAMNTTSGGWTNAPTMNHSSVTPVGITTDAAGWTTSASESDGKMIMTTTDSNGATITTSTGSGGESTTTTIAISDGSLVHEADNKEVSGETDSTMIVEMGSTNRSSTGTTTTESNTETNTTGTHTSAAGTTPDTTPGTTTPYTIHNATIPAAHNATPAATCIEVSVHGDATYCIEGPICSGYGDWPAGTMCPMKGDVAVQDCHEMLSSYTNSSACVAPKNAGCIEIEAGAWGCVFEQEGAETPAPTSANMDVPTPAPTRAKIDVPTPAPTRAKIDVPTPAPTRAKIDVPTPAPTRAKIDVPTPAPTRAKIDVPTPAPTRTNMDVPTPAPTRIKVDVPTPAPTRAKIDVPTPAPTRAKIDVPTPAPTRIKVDVPTPVPTRTRMGVPTPAPTEQTEQPTPAPTSGIIVPDTTHNATTPAACIEVSVEGDATYCIEGPICSGYGDWPAGTMCPMKGDIAVQDCHEMLSSYTNSSACVAPKNAGCIKIGTGAWGCVFEQEGAERPAPTRTETVAPAPTLTTAESGSQGLTSTDVQAIDASTAFTAPSTPETRTEPEVQTTAESAAAFSHGTTYTYEQQQQHTQQMTQKQQTQQLTQQTAASSSPAQTVSTLSADAIPADDDESNGISSVAIVGILVAVCAVVALAGFTVIQRRQRSSDEEVPSSAYYRQPETPLTQSIKL